MWEIYKGKLFMLIGNRTNKKNLDYKYLYRLHFLEKNLEFKREKPEDVIHKIKE